MTAAKAAKIRLTPTLKPTGSSVRSVRPMNSEAATKAVAIQKMALCRCQARIRLLGKIFRAGSRRNYPGRRTLAIYLRGELASMLRLCGEEDAEKPPDLDGSEALCLQIKM